MSNLVEVVHLNKFFSDVQVLFDLHFSVKKQEIHCLVGENGAGKSTLMKILSGVYPYGSYEGDIIFNGKPLKVRDVKESENAGIAIIHQELSLVPEMTVYENIFLGHEITKGWKIDAVSEIDSAKRLLKEIKAEHISPTDKVKELSVSKQQLVEIAKALSRQPKLLILDEPTSSLSETESENLLNLLKLLKKQGMTIILITHRLKEVIHIADTITVLRDGRSVASFSNDVKKVDEKLIIRHMVGRDIQNLYPPRRELKKGECIFEVRNWYVREPYLQRTLLSDINLKLNRGEIVGLFGLVGAGRTEFGLSLFGNYPGYDIQGKLILHGKEMHFLSPKDALRHKFLYLTEDRKEKGLILIHSIRENITLSNLKEIHSLGWIDQSKELNVVNDYKTTLNIKTRSVEAKVSSLSGGNQQKVLLAKGLFAKPDVIILDEPTRGVDVGAKYEIYRLMQDLKSEGKAILLVSSELPEIIGMSDRMYVMAKGRITAELSRDEMSQETIMSYAVN